MIYNHVRKFSNNHDNYIFFDCKKNNTADEAFMESRDARDLKVRKDYVLWGMNTAYSTVGLLMT